MKIVKTIFSTLFGLMFINAGLDKHLHYMPKPELDAENLKAFESFIALVWLMPLVAVVEILGGLLFIFPKTRALGAIVILPIMVGVVLHNAVFMPEGLAIAGPLFLINIWMISDNWEKYRGIFR